MSSEASRVIQGSVCGHSDLGRGPSIYALDVISVLRLDAGADHEGSLSRAIADAVQAALSPTQVRRRDLAADPLPPVDGAWVRDAFSAAPNVGSGPGLAVSDEVIDELVAADVLLISSPIYNLGVPAPLKGWIDQMVRLGRTFGMNGDELVPLLDGIRAIVVVAAGGTEIDGPDDFATPYLRRVLEFVGIDRVDVIPVMDRGQGPDTAVADAMPIIAAAAAASS